MDKLDMGKLDFILEELVTANRILANEGIVDSFGHVSARHPDNPKHYLLSRARAPERIERGDIIEYTLEGEALNKKAPAPYLERFIHGAIYEARPDVHAIVHNHSPSVIPFGATGTKLRPLMHMSASCGHEVDIWDSQTSFGDTHLLVANVEMGRDLAKFLGPNVAALMRGNVREAPRRSPSRTRSSTRACGWPTRTGHRTAASRRRTLPVWCAATWVGAPPRWPARRSGAACSPPARRRST